MTKLQWLIFGTSMVIYLIGIVTAFEWGDYKTYPAHLNYYYHKRSAIMRRISLRMTMISIVLFTVVLCIRYEPWMIFIYIAFPAGIAISYYYSTTHPTTKQTPKFTRQKHQKSS